MTKNNLPSLKYFNLAVIALIVVGLLFIGLSSSTEGLNLGNDQFLFFRKQVIWVGLGIIAFLLGRIISLSFLKKFSKIFYFITLGLLLLVLIPSLGISTLGASRRLDFGIFVIQPSEIVKLTAIIYFSFMFSQPNLNRAKNLLTYLSPALILIILEPNLSTAVLLASVIISLYYLSGGNIFSIFFIGISALLLGSALIFFSPYRKARLTTSYHSNQLILAIGSGGLFGKGLGNSEQKYRFLPKIPTDSILAIIGEETGLVGIFFLILAYLYLISYLFKLSQNIIIPQYSYIVAGIALWITFQTLINFAAISNLIPLTGQPLPFISYGGSSLITLLFSIGLVGNIHSQALLYSDKHEKKPQNTHHRQSSHSSHRTNPRTAGRRKI